MLAEVKDSRLCGHRALAWRNGHAQCLLCTRRSGGALAHHFVHQCFRGLLGPKLSGDREMDKSQQSLQADRITRREFLYEVTDG